MIHVLIERYIARGMLSTYEKNCATALQQTCVVPGYISGETFADQHDENHRFVMCKWRTLNDWENWYRSHERMDLMGMIAPILEKPEKITALKNK